MVKINPEGPFGKWKVKNSKIHGRGVFAAENIKKGTMIAEYVGEKITSKEGTRRSEAHPTLSYIFTLNSKWDIDGAVGGNGSQYMNHCCMPNCDVDIVKQRIWIYAIKDIKKGQEILYDYSFDADDLQPCCCGAKDKLGRNRCRGYMNEASTIPKLKRKAEREAKKKAKKKKHYHKKTNHHGKKKKSKR